MYVYVWVCLESGDAGRLPQSCVDGRPDAYINHGAQKVDGARLTSLLAAFQRDRDHAAGAAAAPAASTPSPPLTRAPTGLKHLAFGKGLDWEADNQALCEAFAEESEREDSGLAGLEVGGSCDGFGLVECLPTSI